MNKLMPNISKTKLMLFNSRKENILTLDFFNNEIVGHINSFKYLGILIDIKLNFKLHAEHLCSKLSKEKYRVFCMQQGTILIKRV